MQEPRIEKLQEIPVLLDIYGCLLTDKQREALSLFYEEDYSLSEIAALGSNSRQAVHNLITRGEALLHSYENSLHLMQKEAGRRAAVQKLRELLRSLPKDNDTAAVIEDILCQL